jgi:hydrogenase nickel incorporation protein HypA/HybF
MHELALMESLVAAVNERVVEGRVVAIRLEIGKLAAVVPDALRFSFDVCAQGTRAQGARLEIESIDGRGTCRACGVERAVDTLFSACPCGSYDVALVAGEELRVRELEVI